MSTSIASAAPTAAAASAASDASSSSSSRKRYRKEKPWDTDDIDHWAPIPVTPDTPLPPPLEESSFAVLFPRYREKYLREVWPLLTSALKHFGIACALDLVEGSMTVRTTRKCWDVSMILKARDCIKLLSRSLPVHQALRVLQDETYCDVVKIKNLVRSRERFVKRRQRLIGPNGCTLKAIELVTECYVLVQGNTVSAIGPLKGVKAVRRIVEDAMRNVHPIYHIKLLMIKQQLAADPTLRNDSWDRFLPRFRKRTVDRKRPPVKNKDMAAERERSVFPPPPTKRKVDLLMESGEYFLSKEEKEQKAETEKQRRRAEEKDRQRQEREKDFVPPPEHGKNEATREGDEQTAAEGERKRKRRKKLQEGEAKVEEQAAGGVGMEASAVDGVELGALKEKLLKGKRKRAADAAVDAAKFILGSARRGREAKGAASGEAAELSGGGGGSKHKKSSLRG